VGQLQNKFNWWAKTFAIALEEDEEVFLKSKQRNINNQIKWKKN